MATSLPLLACPQLPSHRPRRQLLLLAHCGSSTPWRDLLLFVATPLLIVPALLGLQSVIAVAALNKWVMAFGADGSPPARDDASVWRSRIVSQVQDSAHRCPVDPRRRVRALRGERVARDAVRGVRVGRVARADADAWVPAHLRLEAQVVRAAHGMARHVDVPDVVRRRCDLVGLARRLHRQHDHAVGRPLVDRGERRRAVHDHRGRDRSRHRGVPDQRDRRD